MLPHFSCDHIKTVETGARRGRCNGAREEATDAPNSRGERHSTLSRQRRPPDGDDGVADDVVTVVCGGGADVGVVVGVVVAGVVVAG